MRRFVCGLAVTGLAALAPGCASTGKATAGAPTSAGAMACVMESGGHGVLRVMAPADSECVAKDGSLHLKSHDRYVDIWLVPGARTVAEGAGRAAQTITPEFKDFKQTGAADVTVAGAPAKRMEGSGTEADDGDPGTADVIVFKTGDHVFVACTHGESLTLAARQWMSALVQTAQAP